MLVFPTRGTLYRFEKRSGKEGQSSTSTCALQSRIICTFVRLVRSLSFSWLCIWFNLATLLVLNPFFRAYWFDQDAKSAKTLVSDIAARYLQDHGSAPVYADAAAPPQPAALTSSLPSSGSGLLKSMGSFEIPAVPIPSQMSDKEQLDDKLKRYFGFEGGRGNMLNPLPWWKVCGYRNARFTLIDTLSRCMNRRSQSLQGWPAISFPFRRQASRSSGSFPSRFTSVKTFAALSRLTPYAKLC
jgi:hypothetical protein